MRLYKFVDEATGLFWTGDLKGPSEKLFNQRGIEYRSAKAADEAFRNYEITRVGEPKMALPEVKMLVFRIDLIEIERKPFSSAPDTMRLTRFAISFGKQDRLTGFVRTLSERSQRDFMEFRFIVQRAPRAEVDATPLQNAVISSRKSGKKFIAIRSDADLMYLRMALGEGFVTAYDLDTGEKV